MHTARRTFGQPMTGRAPGAVPQLGLLTLREIGPHAICGLAIKPLRHGEPWMVGSPLDQLGLGMLLIWDRGFFSYPRIRSVSQRGAHLLARVKSKTVLKPLRRLSDGSQLAKRPRASDHGPAIRRALQPLLMSSRLHICEFCRTFNERLTNKLTEQ